MAPLVWPATFWSTFLPSSPLSVSPSGSLASSSAAPATLALALARLAEAVLALKATAPPAARSRAVLATALSVSTLMASEMPTPVSPDSVSPSAMACELPSWLALSVMSSLTERVPPRPMAASVSLSPTATTITGVTAVSPLAPPVPVVSISLAESASSVRSTTPVVVTLSPSRAFVSVSPTLTAMDAPTPTPLLPSALPVDSAVLDTRFSARIVTLPLTIRSAPLATAARASLRPTLTARPPATPVSLALAPEVALARKVCVWSPSTSAITASTSSPLLVMLPLPTVAWLSTRPTLTATAMPIPVPSAGPMFSLWPSPLGCSLSSSGRVRSTRPAVSLSAASACSLVSYNATLSSPTMRT